MSVITPPAALPVSEAFHTRVSITATLQQHVHQTDEYRPVVGSVAVRLEETNEGIVGWHYDRRRFADEDEVSTINPGYIGNITDAVVDGTVEEHWKSGIGAGDDCKVLGIYPNPQFGTVQYSPSVHQGEYFRFLTNYYLFGDGHIIHPLISGFAEGFDPVADFVTLQYTPSSNSPIVAGVYRRETDGSAFPYHVATLVSSFTGTLISEGEREETIVDGVPGYTKVDSFCRWESFCNPSLRRLYLNANPAFLVGTIDAGIANEDASYKSDILEVLGTSDGTRGQIYWTRYFPIDPGVRISAYDGKSLIIVDDEVWEPVADNILEYYRSTDKVYRIDYDLGVIEFGGQEVEEDYFLAAPITGGDDEIQLIGDVELLPDRGLIQVGDELIKYAGKLSDRVVQCTRGMWGTTPEAHDLYDTVTSVPSGMVPPQGSVIYIGYYTTPRIEYAATYGSEATVADDIDVRPIVVPEANGIVYISRRPLDLHRITLETDKDSMSPVYGPVYVGADYALLTATAYSAGDEPVPRQRLTIEQTSAPPFLGLLGGVADDYTSLANYDGQVTTSFSAGVDLDTFFVPVGEQGADGLGTVLYVSGDYTNIDLDEIYVYVVTKDDPMRGTVGLVTTYLIGSYSATSPLPGAVAQIAPDRVYGQPTVIVSDLYPDGAFDGGTIRVVMVDGISHEADILYWRGGVAHLSTGWTIIPANISYIVMNKANWVAWNASSLNGRKRVLYIYDPTRLHPVTGVAGAYFPLRPTGSSLTGGRTRFTLGHTVPQYDAYDTTCNVGGYLVFLPRTVTFRAYGDSSISGRRVWSDTLSLRVDLPPYMKGVYLDGSTEVPYGWRLPSDDLDAASGLGGATFVTVNPISGYNGPVYNPFASLTYLAQV